RTRTCSSSTHFFCPPPRLTSDLHPFPTRRSSDLIAIAGNPEQRKGIVVTSSYEARAKGVKTTMPLWEAKKLCPSLIVIRFPQRQDRKSTRLNSSHVSISYAVFCLKKKIYRN